MPKQILNDIYQFWNIFNCIIFVYTYQKKTAGLQSVLQGDFTMHLTCIAFSRNNKFFFVRSVYFFSQTPKNIPQILC